jgi:hypothetical protein
MLVVSTQMLVFGYELDLSVNDEIEKKYDSNKLNQDMNTSAATNKKSSKSTTLSNKAVPKSTPVLI